MGRMARPAKAGEEDAKAEEERRMTSNTAEPKQFICAVLLIK